MAQSLQLPERGKLRAGLLRVRRIPLVQRFVAAVILQAGVMAFDGQGRVELRRQAVGHPAEHLPGCVLAITHRTAAAAAAAVLQL